MKKRRENPITDKRQSSYKEDIFLTYVFFPEPRIKKFIDINALK
jgi:hypothetical protein